MLIEQQYLEVRHRLHRISELRGTPSLLRAIVIGYSIFDAVGVAAVLSGLEVEYCTLRPGQKIHPAP